MEEAQVRFSQDAQKPKAREVASRFMQAVVRPPAADTEAHGRDQENMRGLYGSGSFPAVNKPGMLMPNLSVAMGAGPRRVSRSNGPGSVFTTSDAADTMQSGSVADSIEMAAGSGALGVPPKPRSPATYSSQHIARLQHMASHHSPRTSGGGKPGSPGEPKASPMAASPQITAQTMTDAAGAHAFEFSRQDYAELAPIRMQPLVGRPDVPALKLGLAAGSGGALSARIVRSAGGAEDGGTGAGASTLQRRASLTEAAASNSISLGGAATGAQSARIGAEGWRRLSHDSTAAAGSAAAASGALGARALPEVSAADRRELLRQYQAQKQQRQQQAGGGLEPPGFPKTGRLSLGGIMPGAFGKPPVPVAGPASRAPIPRHPAHMPKPLATAVVAHAAATPLPDAGNDAGDAGLASPGPMHHAPAVSWDEGSSVPSRPSLPPPVPGSGFERRFSISSVASNSSLGGSGGASGVVKLNPPRMSLPGMQGAGAVGDVRAELKALRLAELQWRVLNAKAAQAMRSRQEKSEQALAAAALAVAQLHAAAVVGQALSARDVERQRAQRVADLAQPALGTWAQLQGELCDQLAAVSQALHHSLTAVPLVGGACCGGPTALDMGQLQDAMDRGMYVLQSLDAALQPLFHGVTPSHSNPATDVAAPAAGAGVLSELPAGLVQLPTAQALTELASTVGQEAQLLGEVLAQMKALQARQLMLDSHMVQLAQMQREGMM